LDSIPDLTLREYLRDKVVVSGGCIASLLRGDPVNDFDIYFTERDAAIKVANHYLAVFAANPPKRYGDPMRMWVDTKKDDRVSIVIKSVGVASVADGPDYQYFETAGVSADAGTAYAERQTAALDNDEEAKIATQLLDSDTDISTDAPAAMAELTQAIVDDIQAPKHKGAGAAKLNQYRPLFISTNAITLSDQVQLITRFYGTIEDIHRNFDFVHCQCAWSQRDGLVLPPDALESLLSGRLKYSGSLYPLCSLIRTRKFVSRGWTAPASVFIKAAYQAAKLDLNDIEVWRDQLTGVDSAYFIELMDILTREKESGKVIDGAYVVALIDRMM
jgi:hypothetical protein